jgi:hypothetical protein
MFFYVRLYALLRKKYGKHEDEKQQATSREREREKERMCLYNCDVYVANIFEVQTTYIYFIFTQTFHL